MIGAVAPGRLRAVCAVTVVAGLLFSLLALCCCVDVDDTQGPSRTHDAAGFAAVHVALSGMTTSGDLDEGCGQLSAPVAVARASAAHGVPAVATPVLRADLDAAATAAPASGARSRPPVPHLLCVMRT
jgi:hypothetical protein